MEEHFGGPYVKAPLSFRATCGKLLKLSLKLKFHSCSSSNSLVKGLKANRSVKLQNLNEPKSTFFFIRKLEPLLHNGKMFVGVCRHFSWTYPSFGET